MTRVTFTERLLALLLCIPLLCAQAPAKAEPAAPTEAALIAQAQRAPYPDDYPLTDTDGFLTAGEYVSADAEAGLWIYLSATLQVEIRRYADTKNKLQWFETEVRTKPGERMYTPHMEEPKRSKFRQPQTWAADNHSVLVITDDDYGYQLVKGVAPPGVVIRGGEILSDRAKKKNGSGWPKEEVLAYFPDGRMETYDVQEHTAQEYLDMGAVEVFSFGPVLIHEGQIGEKALDPKYYRQREPRCAIGMLEPNHYLILTVKGRTDNARGVYLDWLALRMAEWGVQEALNLDGGGTVALVFMGELLNYKHPNNRKVSSVIAFGRSDLVGGGEEP